MGCAKRIFINDMLGKRLNYVVLRRSNYPNSLSKCNKLCSIYRQNQPDYCNDKSDTKRIYIFDNPFYRTVKFSSKCPFFSIFNSIYPMLLWCHGRPRAGHRHTMHIHNRHTNKTQKGVLPDDI